MDSRDLIFKEENIHLGLAPNSKKPADYEKAEALLMKIRPYVTYFHSSKYMADIASRKKVQTESESSSASLRDDLIEFELAKSSQKQCRHWPPVSRRATP